MDCPSRQRSTEESESAMANLMVDIGADREREIAISSIGKSIHPYASVCVGLAGMHQQGVSGQAIHAYGKVQQHIRIHVFYMAMMSSSSSSSSSSSCSPS